MATIAEILEAKEKVKVLRGENVEKGSIRLWGTERTFDLTLPEDMGELVAIILPEEGNHE